MSSYEKAPYERMYEEYKRSLKDEKGIKLIKFGRPKGIHSQVVN